MQTRNMAAAFLTSEDKVLMMHRDINRKLAPGMWAAVGGHLEPEELNNPKEACLREIREETGICSEDIHDLHLRYIVLRRVAQEIRITYYFFGELMRVCPLIETAEGTLHWLEKNKLSELPMTFSVRSIIEHWLNAPDCRCIMTCAVNGDNDQITWGAL